MFFKKVSQTGYQLTEDGKKKSAFSVMFVELSDRLFSSRSFQLSHFKLPIFKLAQLDHFNFQILNSK